MTLRVPRLFGLVTALLLLLDGCGDPTPVEIGFIGGLSGRVADLGVAALNGARLAIEEQNAKGGIAGRPIEMTAEDDRQDADAALGGKIAATLSFKSGMVGDFAALARQAAQTHAEGILILGNAADAAQLCQQIRLVDPQIPIVRDGKYVRAN